MMAYTTRTATPATAGPGTAAPSDDPGLDRILADPGISATAKLVVIALCRNWAWYKDHCWPSDATIARAIGKSVGHVQRCLHELESAGIIRRDRAGLSGRTIVLLWRSAPARDDPPSAQIDLPSPTSEPPAPARDEQRDEERKNQTLRNVPDIPPTNPTSPAPVNTTTTPRVAEVAEPVADEIKAVGPGYTPEQTRRLATRIATALGDVGSLGFYIATIAKVITGTISRDCLIAAYKAGVGAVGKAQKPGAIFVWTLNNYVPPPKPSEIRYHQQRTVVNPPVDGPSPEDRAREIHELKTMAGDPRHPFQRVAQKRLVELEGNHPPTPPSIG